ncbi:hypothetical protein, partial [Stenotrophomonas maltophilia]|uniref:hypothetical protein n=1 Tax=Stenotrophomonas maltophilia TaxID=40324 RepID=UPI0019538E32
ISILNGVLIASDAFASDLCHSHLPPILVGASFLLKRLNRAVEVPTLASEVFDVPAVSAVKLARQTGICVLTPFAELAGEGGNEYSSRDRNQL